MKKYIEIRKNAYYDSVTLMSLSADIKKREDVSDIVVSMGTKMNKELLVRVGLSSEKTEDCTESDLIIAFCAEEGTKEEEIVALIEEKLKGTDGEERERVTYQSLKQAAENKEDANLAVISVPGEHAYREAKTALRFNKNVMLFSDNISIEQEKDLKETAHQRQLLVMGPDCGTCMIQGIGLCFANKVRSGNIGIAGASGTGMQEVMTLIDEYGGGISSALGVGGRDLSHEIGGIMIKDVLRLLQADDKTEIIVMVSKLPDSQVFQEILELIEEEIVKPVILAITCTEQPKVTGKNVFIAESLQKAAAKAVELSTGEKVSLCENIIAYSPRLSEKQKYIRALYCGGTLCAESFYYLSGKEKDVYSNVSHDTESRLENVFQSHHHVLLDLGDDLFTNGRPHPMMDGTIRIDRILQECQDEETAVVLLDFELGYGSGADPVGDTIGAIIKGKELAAGEGREVIFVCYICGTNSDEQDKRVQRKKLETCGCIIAESNIEAIKIAQQMVSRER